MGEAPEDVCLPLHIRLLTPAPSDDQSTSMGQGEEDVISWSYREPHSSLVPQWEKGMGEGG